MLWEQMRFLQAAVSSCHAKDPGRQAGVNLAFADELPYRFAASDYFLTCRMITASLGQTFTTSHDWPW